MLYEQGPITEPVPINFGAMWEELKRKPKVLNPKESTILLVIDAQNGFCLPKPWGQLYVPGAEKDCDRIAKLIHTNVEKFSQIVASMDRHLIMAAYHPSLWEDNPGLKFIPKDKILEQARRDIHTDLPRSLPTLLGTQIGIEGGVMVWPFHCLGMDTSSALHPAVLEAITYFAMAKREEPMWIEKGTGAFAHPYSPFHPIVAMSNIVYGRIQDTVLKAKRIVVVGEASTHCVHDTIADLVPQLEESTELIVLEDCMSPIPGFEQQWEDLKNEISGKTRAKVIFTTSSVLVL